MTTTISKYSVGIGDRFGLEGAAQLRAFQAARDGGVTITPVWNKSNREHSLIGTRPEDVRAEAAAAVKSSQWAGPYFVDADHIGLATVDKFLAASDFFTIDVADLIGKSASDSSIAKYTADMQRFSGALPFRVSPNRWLSCRRLSADRSEIPFCRRRGGPGLPPHCRKGGKNGHFRHRGVVRRSQQPADPGRGLWVLAALARGEGVRWPPWPRAGEFLKGIDYVGDVKQFHPRIRGVLSLSWRSPSKPFGLPASLKLSVHSGSDKFSLYPIIRRAIHKADAGIHLKTAGTIGWKRVIGLAAARGRRAGLRQGLVPGVPTAATTNWPSPISRSSP